MLNEDFLANLNEVKQIYQKTLQLEMKLVDNYKPAFLYRSTYFDVVREFTPEVVEKLKNLFNLYVKAFRLESLLKHNEIDISDVSLIETLKKLICVESPTNENLQVLKTFYESPLWNLSDESKTRVNDNFISENYYNDGAFADLLAFQDAFEKWASRYLFNAKWMRISAIETLENWAGDILSDDSLDEKSLNCERFKLSDNQDFCPPTIDDFSFYTNGWEMFDEDFNAFSKRVISEVKEELAAYKEHHFHIQVDRFGHKQKDGRPSVVVEHCKWLAELNIRRLTITEVSVQFQVDIKSVNKAFDKMRQHGFHIRE